MSAAYLPLGMAIGSTSQSKKTDEWREFALESTYSHTHLQRSIARSVIKHLSQDSDFQTGLKQGAQAIQARCFRQERLSAANDITVETGEPYLFRSIFGTAATGAQRTACINSVMSFIQRFTGQNLLEDGGDTDQKVSDLFRLHFNAYRNSVT